MSVYLVNCLPCLNGVVAEQPRVVTLLNIATSTQYLCYKSFVCQTYVELNAESNAANRFSIQWTWPQLLYINSKSRPTITRGGGITVVNYISTSCCDQDGSVHTLTNNLGSPPTALCKCASCPLSSRKALTRSEVTSTSRQQKTDQAIGHLWTWTTSAPVGIPYSAFGRPMAFCFQRSSCLFFIYTCIWYPSS